MTCPELSQYARDYEKKKKNHQGKQKRRGRKRKNSWVFNDFNDFNDSLNGCKIPTVPTYLQTGCYMS